MGASVRRVTWAVTGCGVGMGAAQRYYAARLVEAGGLGGAGGTLKKAKKAKADVSFWDSCLFLLRSEYLGTPEYLVS
jgi:hypothetical protein